MTEHLTPDELLARAVRMCPAENIAEIIERIMGAAAEEIAAGRFAEADSAAAVAAFLVAVRPDVPPAR